MMFNRELRFVELIGTLRDRHLLIDPELTTGDKLLPYTTYEMHRAEENGTCRNKSLPESVLLEPNKPTVVDWFVLIDDPSLDADGWYGLLSPGDYQLSIQGASAVAMAR